MKINLFLAPNGLDEFYFTGKNTVVIDALRTTSVICTALANEAKEVIPVASFEYAMKISDGILSGQTLLRGERNTKKIEGFNLGNSPLEYSPETVTGKSIVLITTNGSKAIVKAKFSQNLIICSFLNLSAVTNYLIDKNEDFEILCSAKGSSLNMGDTVCAGKLISEIRNSIQNCELTDSALAAVSLNQCHGNNIKKMLYESEHGKILIENGFEEDLNFCANLNSLSIIPFYNGGSVKLSAN